MLTTKRAGDVLRIAVDERFATMMIRGLAAAVVVVAIVKLAGDGRGEQARAADELRAFLRGSRGGDRKPEPP